MIKRDIHGLTSSQKFILFILYHKDVKNVREFGQKIGFSTYAQISKLISELGKKGFVSKERKSIYSIIKITDKGRELVNDLIK